MQKTLVIGAGRVGLAITSQLSDLSYETLNIGARAYLELEETFRDIGKFDTIFWCARDAGIPGDETNCEGVFFKLLSVLQVKSWQGKFVFLSTAGEIYGDSGDHVNSEESPVNPMSQYGIKKLEHENEILNLSSSAGFCPLILRISNIYELETSDRGIVGAIMRHLILRENLTLSNGNQERDFIQLCDVARIAVTLAGKECFSIINIATGSSISIINLVKLFESALDKKANPIIIEDFTGSRTANFSTSKMNSKISRSPKTIDSVISLVKSSE
jgi:nucleoside-diphosphate-sugar epimerase